MMFRPAFAILAAMVFVFAMASDATEATAQSSSRSRVSRSTSKIRPMGKIRPMNNVRPVPNRSGNGRTTTFIPNYGYGAPYGRYHVPNYPWVSGYPTSRLASPYRQPFNPYTSNVQVYPIRPRQGAFGNTSSHYFGNPNASQYFSR